VPIPARRPLTVRTLAALFAAAALCPPAAPPSAAAGASDPVRIAVLIDGPWDRNEAVLAIFRQEIVALLGDEFGCNVPDGDVHVADWSLAGIDAAIDSALADPDVDVVLGLGVLTSDRLLQRTHLPKPAVAPFVIDGEVQGAPLANGRSGVENLSYITSVSHFRRDLDTFLRIVRFRKLAVLVTGAVERSISGMPERTRAIAAERGVDATVVAVTSSAADALAALPAGTEAVYVAPLLRLPDPEFAALVAGLTERRLPSFSLLGRGEVERGILAGLTPEEEFERIARRTALNIQRILLGEKAAELPVHFTNSERLALNMRTARAIGVRPSWAILTQAERVDAEREVERSVTLTGAVREALAANRDVLAAARSAAAADAEESVSRSVLFPQLEVSAQGVLIDEEQAAASFGQAAERTLSGTATLSQILYSDDAWTGLAVSRSLRISEEEARRQTELDVAQDAATTYLNVLRGLTLERIQRENLERTETNLDLARAREAIGHSGPGEVYRWEGEVATQRRNVIDANAQRNVAEIALNRLLHRPAEEPFRAEDAGMDDPDLGIGDPRVQRYLGDPWSFRVLREFLSGVAREASPELKQVEQGIAAQERVLDNATRAFFLPTVGVEGEIRHVFDRQGEGSDVSALPLPIPEPEDTRWSVGLRASLPLLSGGGRFAERRAAAETLHELRLRRTSLEEKIEQRLRAAMHRAGASYAAIDLTREAAEAAGRNLDLVTDAYSEGVVSILDVIDAQNAALVADQNAANAVYDFLIDYVEVERAAGFLSCLKAEPGDREQMIERLEAFRREREEEP
jgi:outer membrane protein TolC